ncbi:hypothetical protein JST97_14030 [bacterium]|nr:hypothetical protein [bacterium]
MNQPSNLAQLLHRGLQAGGAAFIVSAALSQAARHFLINHSGTQSQFNLAMAGLVGFWFWLGLLCMAPVVWALFKRLEGLFGSPHGYRSDNPDQLWSCREAAAFSLFAGPLWWLAPALIQMSGR